jgi:flagellar motor protein MotB
VPLATALPYCNEFDFNGSGGRDDELRQRRDGNGPRKEAVMAGKGGGAWKVAYADFVTAMMAFFLVMWIVAQDTKVKEAIEHYFVTPMGYAPIGERRQTKTGGVLESKSEGNLPMEEAMSMGRGRSRHTDSDIEGRCTNMVSDWLHADAQEHAYWKEHADRILAAAAKKYPNPKDPSAAEAAATAGLAQLLRHEMHERIPIEQHGMYRDLLVDSMSNINWDELAEDLIDE